MAKWNNSAAISGAYSQSRWRKEAIRKRVIAVLEKTPAAHPLITREPSPQALVVKLDAESVAFELRAWTDQSHQWMQIRRDLAIVISSALAEECITIR